MNTKPKPLLCRQCGADLWAGQSGWICSGVYCDAKIEPYGVRRDEPAKLDIVTKDAKLRTPCSECKGTGRVPCPDCEGSGIAFTDDDWEEDCDECDGAATVECLECGGTGIQEE